MGNQKAFAEAILLKQSALITLFELDLTVQEGAIFYYFPGTDPNGENVIWQGNEYVQYPVETKGYEIRSQGTLPRPSISFSNVFGVFSALCREHNDLIGCKLTRKRTFEKFLDGKPGADPTAHFPDDVYYIDRKTQEDRQVVVFEMASPLDVDDVSLPKRRIIATLCQWNYRSGECSYAEDTVVADANDNLIGDPKNFIGEWVEADSYVLGDIVYRVINGRRFYYWCKLAVSGLDGKPPNDTYWIADECSKHLLGCRLRFGANSPTGLPFGAMPAIARLPF